MCSFVWYFSQGVLCFCSVESPFKLTWVENWEVTSFIYKSLQGIRIIQETVGAGRTMLISDIGQVYAFVKTLLVTQSMGLKALGLPLLHSWWSL